MPEVDLCRQRLAKYCVGVGLDVGFGGADPIVPWAICLDRSEDNPDRAHYGKHPTHLVGDAASLYWFADDMLDFVFSSHCLEDFIDTRTVLQEWLRVLKPGGNLIIFCPDQAAYELHCRRNGSLPNQGHKHAEFGLEFVKAKLATLGINSAMIPHQIPLVDTYSFDLVVVKPERQKALPRPD